MFKWIKNGQVITMANFVKKITLTLSFEGQNDPECSK